MTALRPIGSMGRGRRGSRRAGTIDWGRSPRRLPRLRTVIAVLAVVIALLGAGAAVQLFRSVPPLQFQRAVSTRITVPGTPPALPWPTRGEATVGVLGVGQVGSSGPSTSVPIASLTKVMTAYVVLADHPLGSGQSGPAITMTDADARGYVTGLSQNQSVVRVQAGEQLSELQALQAALIGSANNIASALAVWDAGSTTAFVAKMNAAAASLGMGATHYVDATGLDAGSVSNATDQVTLATRLMANPVFAGIVDEPQVTLPVAGIVYNFNSLAGHNGIIGIKTGSTIQAGGCFLFAAQRTVAGHTAVVIGAVLGQQGPSILQAALSSAQKLIDAAAGSLQPVQFSVPGGRVGTVTAPWGGAHAVLAAPATLLAWPGMTVTVVVSARALGRTLVDGQTVGTVTYTLGTQSQVVPATVAGAVPGPTLSWRLRRL